jgi:hypothetical protein
MKPNMPSNVILPLAFATCALLFITGCGTLGHRGFERNAPTEDAPPPGAGEGVVEALDGRVAVELRAAPNEIRADQQVTLRVVNQGDVGLSYGRPVTVERWEGSAWVETQESRDAAWTMELLFVLPGREGVEQRWPFSVRHRPNPGWYRFSKQVRAEGVNDDQGPIVLHARVRVHD